MDQNETILQRYGGHLVLLIVGLLLFLGGRATLATDALDFEMAVDGQEPLAAALAAPGAEEATVPELDGESSAPTPLPTVNLAALPVREDGSLSPALDPETFMGQTPDLQLERYVVEPYDTPNGIADRFGISPATLLGCNPELGVESSLLRVGVELIICPEDGLLHEVRPGDTVERIAEEYGVPAEDIISFEGNRLEFPYRLYLGTKLFVPGAEAELFVWTPPTLPVGRSDGQSPEVGGGFAPLVTGTGFFGWPVAIRDNITQYYWYGHRGVDLALVEGAPVYASDRGTVTYAGWSIYCYGNLIVVNHGNGFETFYAHLSGIYVTPGQVVEKGAVIGAVGNTGCSSGSHLHFEIRLNTVPLDPLSGYLP